jgi:hypothetical protein
MYRSLRLAGLAVAVLLAPAAADAATEPAVVPLPDMLYEGRISYPHPMQFTLRTSRDSRSVNVQPGFFTPWRNCNANGTTFWLTDLPSRQWLRIRSDRSFAGRGSGTARYNSELDMDAKYSWTIRGRFTAQNRARGRLTISMSLLQHDRVLFRCKQMTASWQTTRTRPA